MADKEAAVRLRQLAEAASDFKIDYNIPIRRYFRSGQEMLKMAQVYLTEDNQEAAYVLYMKYMTLFMDKIRTHRDYVEVIPAEKKKLKGTLKVVLSKTETLKMSLLARFGAEHAAWLEEESARRAGEEAAWQEEEEERERREAEQLSLERDRQLALYHQAQLDWEARPTPQLPSSAVQYDPAKYSDEPTAPASAPPPSYDRTAKPAAPAAAVPAFDRSAKPAETGSAAGLRTVVVPADLVKVFLGVARTNSDRGLETLGTLGGRLSNNQLLVTHLLIPRQTGKSDSCTMEGLEDVWDVHDREDIIFLGWIHTHPAYSVFLSSVDMHNQYEWQHMLPEALATVCSIKDGVTGHLRLTEAGLQEVGACSLTNFHPHTKEPPLWEEAEHVKEDASRAVVLKDLR